jgi:hypothetical protein
MAIHHNQPVSSDHLSISASQQPAVPLPQAATFSNEAVHPPTVSPASPLSYVDIYIDDFLAIAQRTRLLSTLAHTLTSIFDIFRDAPHPADAATRKHIISQTKLLKGDAAWSTSKIVLGWLINTEHMTIALPQHKAHRLHTILQEFPTKPAHQDANGITPSWGTLAHGHSNPGSKIPVLRAPARTHRSTVCPLAPAPTSKDSSGRLVHLSKHPGQPPSPHSIPGAQSTQLRQRSRRLRCGLWRFLGGYRIWPPAQPHSLSMAYQSPHLLVIGLPNEPTGHPVQPRL